ncbi:hypothetical protein C8J57DRAFT_1245999 [Mycena rebaudengoi]|nr:hypothetical protein C8J57DRAFT_1245999 [Mycena rebaudengoi]
MQYSLISLFALVLAASVSARPTLQLANRQFKAAGKPIGTKLGKCTLPESEDICFDGDVATCQDGQITVTQTCSDGVVCLLLPVGGNSSNTISACSTAAEQTALFAIAFGGIENIPTDR